jgi:hypothetical protein
VVAHCQCSAYVVKVGVIKHNERVFTAELQNHRRQSYPPKHTKQSQTPTDSIAGHKRWRAKQRSERSLLLAFSITFLPTAGEPMNSTLSTPLSISAEPVSA